MPPNLLPGKLPAARYKDMAHAPSDKAHWMRRCLVLAAHGAGTVSPNPLVGAVVVGSDGTVLGEGWHGKYGGPHAEVYAIENALESHGAESLKQATLYVNLEPCSAEGKTPPCADLIIRHNIPRVVIGARDPHPNFSGGIDRLREAGITVETGILEPESYRLNEAFFHWVESKRPLLTLKVAQSLDARVAYGADAEQQDEWISCRESRTLVHRWRAALDGVLVGSGTARTDDPALTVRHVDGRQPQRFVLDREGALPSSLQLFSDDYAHRTTAVTGEAANPEYAGALKEAGGAHWRMPENDGHLDLTAVLDRMGEEGGRNGRPMNSLLVEAGPSLSGALFEQNLVDRFYLFIAPSVLGNGPSLLRPRFPADFADHTWTSIGNDMLFRGYMRQAPRYE